ncbi:helix-turn-helix domain-containing protein [Umezawaea endophytica]|uniref:Helix-turn-helix domain-containing protein n=1 Tax=Umezawaea endophytica TaxID=1654476 RepID=A0A9X3AIK1_9PSEU|nr:helix-turn-helix domain-containing protein [Umezawaea endophytica]MCS7483242.1 helix-turn-helix domain-containing protein [Umezawaea endophytica]
MTEHDPRDALGGFSTFAERFDHLMSHIPRARSSETRRRRSPYYSNAEIGRLIGKSEPYISNLRNSKSDNPTMDVIVAIAEVFAVHPGDLIPVATTPLRTHSSRAMHIAARAQHLSPRSLETLEAMVEHFAATDAAYDDT